MSMANEEAYREVCRLAAVEFMDRCSLTPTPDATDQLVDAFLPALARMCEGGYEPNGKQWRALGWRGLIKEMWKRMERLMYNNWEHNHYDGNAAMDMINFTGYYYRLKNEGPSFGKMGKPGPE